MGQNERKIIMSKYHAWQKMQFLSEEVFYIDEYLFLPTHFAWVEVLF